MSRQQQQLLMAWDAQYPVTAWEKERDNRIAAVMGHHNPFVTGNRTWSLENKPSRDGIVSVLPVRPSRAVVAERADPLGSIIGNRNIDVYHLPKACPNYDKVSSKNRVQFRSEQEAIAAGSWKAGNCRSR